MACDLDGLVAENLLTLTCQPGPWEGRKKPLGAVSNSAAQLQMEVEGERDDQADTQLPSSKGSLGSWTKQETACRGRSGLQGRPGTVKTSEMPSEGGQSHKTRGGVCLAGS